MKAAGAGEIAQRLTAHHGEIIVKLFSAVFRRLDFVEFRGFDLVEGFGRLLDWRLDFVEFHGLVEGFGRLWGGRLDFVGFRGLDLVEGFGRLLDWRLDLVDFRGFDLVEGFWTGPTCFWVALTVGMIGSFSRFSSRLGSVGRVKMDAFIL